MYPGPKQILSPFTWCKKWKAWNRTRDKYKPLKRRQKLAETDRGSNYHKEEWLEEIIDTQDAFYNGRESAYNDNDDENHNENNDQRQLPEGFANSCHIIVSPTLLLELISNFAVCKYCSGTFLLVEVVNHGFGLDLHISKRNQTFY